MVVEFLFHVQRAETIGPDPVEQLSTHVEGRDTETAQDPFVRPAAQGIDASRFDVDWEHSYRLNGVGIEDGTDAVSEVGQGAHVVSKPVLVRDPRHRHQPRPAVDERLDVADVHASRAVPGDAHLDTSCLLQVAVEHEFGFVMQLVDHDVVARSQIESVGHDVLALAGREQKADLVGPGVDEPRKLRAHLVCLSQHVAERDGACGLALEERPAGGNHLVGNWRDVGRVQVVTVAHDWEIAAHAKRILRATSADRGRLPLGVGRAVRGGAQRSGGRRE